jgi:hypothetical protein
MQFRLPARLKSRAVPQAKRGGMGGATNKNKGLRQIVNPFLMSKIDYKDTTKWGF